MNYLEGMSYCDEIAALAGRVLDRMGDHPDSSRFAGSVRDLVLEIQGTIEETGRVTAGQAEALNNMEEGLERWLVHTQVGEVERPAAA